MGLRDSATSSYLELERMLIILDDIANCGDLEEAIADSQEVASDIRSVMERMNRDFQLNMEEI